MCSPLRDKPAWSHLSLLLIRHEADLLPLPHELIVLNVEPVGFAAVVIEFNTSAHDAPFRSRLTFDKESTILSKPKGEPLPLPRGAREGFWIYDRETPRL